MKTLYVYILECADDSFYVGVTNDVGRRFIEHIRGIHDRAFTYERRPLKLVFCRQFTKPLEAIQYEKQVKGWTRSKKIALIKNDIGKLHELAGCQNDSHSKNFKGQSERSRTLTQKLKPDNYK
jgi:putative endonuclease